jgi:hypothetical protein
MENFDELISKVLLESDGEVTADTGVYEKILKRSTIIASKGASQSTAGSYGKIDIIVDYNAHVTLATSHKLGNIRFNLKDALLTDVSDLGGAVLSTIAVAKIPFLIPLYCLQILRYLRNLAKIQLSLTDGQVLKLLSDKKDENRTAMRADIKSDELTQEAIDASLKKLEDLGCVTIIGDEVVINEDIEITQGT